jgi:hypothetical protein
VDAPQRLVLTAGDLGEDGALVVGELLAHGGDQ